jgi:two-component system aerobic respiration control sensor histidine kinase ArcB
MLAELFGINARATGKLRNNEHVSINVSKTEDCQLLDMETISDFIESMGIDAFKRSTDLFAKLSPKYCDELQSAINNTDIEEYSSVAHKLKGASGSVGLKEVQQHTKMMEKECKNVAFDVAQEWLDELLIKLEDGQKKLALMIEN